MRLGEGQGAEPANKEAREASWKRMKEILEQS
jgi:hypothetical protein